jgi:two-component system cell cycle sensor histidine kinase/response regulator CckA
VSRRILVVDDEAALRELISRGFRQRGYEVVEAGDGLAGLDVARSATVPFDLVVTNSRMPHLDGAHLAECLRELDPTLPILHISGSHPSRHHELPDDIPTIFKPFNIWDLLNHAEELMSRRTQR